MNQSFFHNSFPPFLAMEALKKAYEMFGGKLYEIEGKYPGEYHFLDDKAMRNVPEILKGMEIGEVYCNEAFALIPQKTVVFLTEVSYEKNAECIKLCESCSQKNCSNRMEKTKKHLAALNYGYQLTFMTSHPKDLTDDVIEVIAKEEKILKEIHLPAQSGNNRIILSFYSFLFLLNFLFQSKQLIDSLLLYFLWNLTFHFMMQLKFPMFWNLL